MENLIQKPKREKKDHSHNLVYECNYTIYVVYLQRDKYVYQTSLLYNQLNETLNYNQTENNDTEL